MSLMRQLLQGLRGEVVLLVTLREDRLLPLRYITILFELLTFFIFAQIEHIHNQFSTCYRFNPK